MASPSMIPASRTGLAPTAGDLKLRPATMLQRTFSALADWNDRYRQRIHLAQLDERMLRDMGLTRADAVGEYDKPFWRG